MADVGPITTQPGAEKPEQTEVVPGPSGNPDVPGPSANADGKWAASRCDIGAWCYVMCCCCCTLQEIAGYTGRNACLHCCCPLCTPCLRKALREKHGIKGSLLEDILCTFTPYINCCTIAQMHAETKKGQAI